jgi:hypothetical protein
VLEGRRLEAGAEETTLPFVDYFQQREKECEERGEKKGVRAGEIKG